MTLSAPFEIVAHALVGRRDLPIPEWLFAWAASLVLIVSFVALSMAWHRSRFEGSEWRPVPAWLSRALINPATEVIAGAIGVFLLGVVVWSGLKGTEAPDRNFSLTFVFYTVWVGVVFVSVFAGDVFRAFNPWRAIARAIGGVFRLVAGQSQSPPLSYPERLGRWPAVGAIAGFVILELVFGASGFGTLPGLTPHRVAIATLVYTAYTLVAMVLFGREEWLRRGEGFSVYFGMFASLSPLEVRDRVLGSRGWLTAATRWIDSPGSVAMILLAIGSTTFDGAAEGVLSTPITNLYNSLNDAGLSPATALRLDNAVFFAATLAFVFGLFWAGIYGMHTVKESVSTRRLGELFGHAFISIALAYVAAHYFSALVDQEQAQFGFLLSDPLGDGSDYFGTAGNGINYGVISATAVWYIQVAALVSGHVIALVLGHDRALKVYGDTRLAARSQYWMLALMVGFTSLGLYLLSQSNA
jgi:hypothetical protein